MLPVKIPQGGADCPKNKKNSLLDDEPISFSFILTWIF